MYYSVLHLVPFCSLTLALSKLRICPWKAAGLLRATGTKTVSSTLASKQERIMDSDEARLVQTRCVSCTRLYTGFPIRLTLSFMWETLHPANE